jgi:putative PIN family toxin of toxin-antitoxin system
MKTEHRYVCDANVLISAALFINSKPRQALDKIQTTGILLMSQSIFTELTEVLFRSKFDRYLSIERRENFLDLLLDNILWFEPTESITICRDPKDNKYLELAVEGLAESVITGDEDLLVLHPFQQIQILTVQAFLLNS